MTISKTNWFAKYYNWVYRHYANDLCSFFWGSLLAIGLFFIVIPGRLCGGKYSGGTFKDGIIAWIVYGVTILFGYIWVDNFGYKPVGFLGWTLLCPVVALLFATAMGLVVVSCVFTVEKITVRQERRYLDDTTSSIRNWIGAIRGKYCTKINWK